MFKTRSGTCCTKSAEEPGGHGGVWPVRVFLASIDLIRVKRLEPVLQEAQQHLALLASHLLDCPVEDLCFQDRQVSSRHHPEHHVAFAQLAAVASTSARLPPGVALGLDF